MVLVVQEIPSICHTPVFPAAVQAPSLENCRNQICWTRGVEKIDEDTRKGKTPGKPTLLHSVPSVITFASRCLIQCPTITHLLDAGVVG